MEYWQAWAILILLVGGALAGGFGIAYYFMNKDTADTSSTVQKEEIPQNPADAKPAVQTPAKTTPSSTSSSSSISPLSSSSTSTLAKKLIDKYDTSVNGYLYYSMNNKFLIKNNKIKIIFENVQELAPGIPFNTVYLDTLTKEAVAFCEDIDDASGRKCRGKEKAPISVQYSQFATMTPGDWINKLRSAPSPKVVEKIKTLFNRNVDEVAFDDIILYVDHSYGIPVQAIQGSNQYSYLQLAVNQVSARDVTRPDQ